MARTPQPDKATVENTLRFLDQQLMVQKFILRGVIRKRNRLEHEQMQTIDEEIATRAKIDSLENRAAYELSTHPELFGQDLGADMDGGDGI